MATDLPWTIKQTIYWHTFGAGAVGIPGAFVAHADLGVIAGLWTTMLISIAEKAGDALEKQKAVKIVASVLAGLSIFKLGFKAANTYFAWTGVGTVPAVVANVGVNASLTYLFGVSAAKVLLTKRNQDPAESIAMSILGLIVSVVTGQSVDLDPTDGPPMV